jgi:uncharacterized SAM-binding protein YcdF (DUF218 family)
MKWPPTGRWRQWLIAAVVCLAALLAIYLLRVPILVGIARGVEVEHELAPSGAILLLNGDGKYMARAERAAELYHRGLAPRILIARSENPPAAWAGFYPNDTDVNVEVLRREGVPDSSVRVLTVPGGVTSTTDEGLILAAYLRRNPADRVTVVTTEFHTRRARWAIERAMGDVDVEIRMAGARDPRFHAGNWWRSEPGMLAYFEEYMKFAHNLLYR